MRFLSVQGCFGFILTDTLDARIIIHHHDTKKKLKDRPQFKCML